MVSIEKIVEASRCGCQYDWASVFGKSRVLSIELVLSRNIPKNVK